MSSGRSKRFLGVLAGSDASVEFIAAWAASADVVVAADGGANRLWEAGIVPAAAVGDLDSISPEALAAQESVVEDRDEARTDCDKLLSYFKRLGAEEVTLVGVEGDQLDHTIAALHSAPASGLRVRFALRSQSVWILRGGESLSVAAIPGGRVSLLPLLDCDGATLEGVEWPLAKAKLSPLGNTSVSNRSTGDLVRADIESGAAALFVQSGAKPSWM